MTLIPVTKKGNGKFRGMADEAQIEASKGVLVPIDLTKFAAEAAAADAKAEADEAKKAAAEAKAAEAKTEVSPADVKRSPSKE